jgi:hypothetical protein
MKKQFVTVLLLLIALVGESQTAKDLFRPGNVEIRWLGIDFSHVKLIGDFSQFYGAGEKSNIQIRDNYFASWNRLILTEPDKYDIKRMLMKDVIVYDLEMLTEINSLAPVETMESYNFTNYSEKDIIDFVSLYDIEDKQGIGILFLAESLNKTTEEAFFHFIAISLETKELLIHERLRGKPRGFGLRNYWAGSIHSVIKKITKERYKVWMKQFNEQEN